MLSHPITFQKIKTNKTLGGNTEKKEFQYKKSITILIFHFKYFSMNDGGNKKQK